MRVGRAGDPLTDGVRNRVTPRPGDAADTE